MQYPDCDFISIEDGISYYEATSQSLKLKIDCLLFRKNGKILGILNKFNDDVPHLGEKKGNFLVIVHPQYQKKGIGTQLLKEAIKRWDVNLEQQYWTPEGRFLLKRIQRLNQYEKETYKNCN